MKRIFRDRRMLLTLALLFVFFAALYTLLPYADDDWDWGTQGGLDRLASGFADYNGRYAGNLLILVLTRFPLLKTLVPALFMTALCALPAALCGGGVGALLLGAALALGVSRAIAQETLLWLSGFANYTTGTVCLLSVLLALKRARQVPFPGRTQALLGLLAFFSTLFMEHITVCLLALTLLAFVWRSLAQRRFARFEFMLFFASLAGAFLMFSNGAYAAIFARQDFYRTVARPASFSQLINDCYLVYYYTLYPNLLREHPFVLAALALACTLLFVRRQASLTGVPRALCGACCAFLCLLSFYLCLCTLHPAWEPLLSYTYGAELAASVLVPPALLLLIAFLAPRQSRERLLLETLCILFLCAPLFVIAPISARNFLPTYALTCVLCVEFAHAALGDRLDRAALPFACAAALAGSLWLTVTLRNFVADRARVKAAREASDAQAQSVVLPQLPYESYMWNATPGAHNDMTKGYFRLFYGLRDDLALDVIDYQTYYERKKSHAAH